MGDNQCVVQNTLAHVTGLELAHTSPELIVADSRGEFCVFDLRSFACIQVFSIPKLAVAIISGFTSVPADGLLIACGRKLHKFKRTIGVREEFADDEAVIYAHFNPISLTFITAAGRGVKIWDALTGRLEREVHDLTDSAITCCCLDDRQRRFILGDHEGHITVFNYTNGAKMKQLDSHLKEVSAIAYVSALAIAPAQSHNPQALLMSPSSRPVTQSGLVSVAATSSSTPSGGASSTPNGTPLSLVVDQASRDAILSASWDRSVVSHTDQMNSKYSVVRKLVEHRKDVTILATSSHLGLIASASSDTTICIYEWGLGPVLYRTELPYGAATAMVFLGTYPLLVVSDPSGGLCVIDVTKGKYKQAIYLRDLVGGRDKPQSITSLLFDPIALTLYTGDDGGSIRAWPLENTIMRGYTPTKPFRPGKADIDASERVVNWPAEEKNAIADRMKHLREWKAHTV
jgi:hypothetical protein